MPSVHAAPSPACPIAGSRTSRLHTLPAAGWGLDFFLPYVLGYPNNSIAIIDAVCMVHPGGGVPPPPGQTGATVTGGLHRQSLYDLPLPKTP